MPKIALVRIFNQQFFDEHDEWFRDHITDFVEVSLQEYHALTEFVYAYNRRRKADRQYIIVEDETHLLPKTIAEALVYAEKQKQLLVETEKKVERQKKEKAKLKKQREKEKLAAEIFKLEAYKEKYAKM